MAETSVEIIHIDTVKEGEEFVRAIEEIFQLIGIPVNVNAPLAEKLEEVCDMFSAVFHGTKQLEYGTEILKLIDGE